MVNGFIKIKDLEEVINTLDQVEGYINKKDFECAVLKLKEYEKPKPTQTLNKSFIILKGVTARDMIGSINRHQASVKFDRGKGCLFGLFADEIKQNGFSLKEEEVYFCTTSLVPPILGRDKLRNENVVLTNSRLREILNISQRKLSKLIGLKIINYQWEGMIQLCSGSRIIAMKPIKGYYNIEDIKKNLKGIK